MNDRRVLLDREFYTPQLRTLSATTPASATLSHTGGARTGACAWYGSAVMTTGSYLVHHMRGSSTTRPLIAVARASPGRALLVTFSARLKRCRPPGTDAPMPVGSPVRACGQLPALLERTSTAHAGGDKGRPGTRVPTMRRTKLSGGFNLLKLCSGHARAHHPRLRLLPGKSIHHAGKSLKRLKP